jgi:hypothetical protein
MKTGKKRKTIFKAFCEGFDSVLDFSFTSSIKPLKLPAPKTDEEAMAADLEALKGDWKVAMEKCGLRPKS